MKKANAEKDVTIKSFFKNFGFNVEDIQPDEYDNGIEGWIVFYDNKNKYRVIDYSTAKYLMVHDNTTNKTDIIKQSKSFNVDKFAGGGHVAYVEMASKAKEIAPKSVDALDTRLSDTLSGAKFKDQGMEYMRSQMAQGKYKTGGPIEDDYVDLFEDYEDMPKKVKMILDKYGLEDEMSYDELEQAKRELEQIGYTFDYYLDGVAYDLRPIGTKGKTEKRDIMEEENGLFARGGYPTGRAWSKEHYNDNDGEDYEIDPAKRIVKARNRYAQGGNLIGNQYKIDMNKNGRIDAEDFEILRSTMNGAWRNEHKHVNHSEDYEKRYARKYNPSRTGYKGRQEYKTGGPIGIGKEVHSGFKIDSWWKDLEEAKKVADELKTLDPKSEVVVTYLGGLYYVCRNSFKKMGKRVYGKGAKIEEVDEERYCRLADDTGHGINEGYIVENVPMYFETEEGLIKYLRECDPDSKNYSDDFVLKDAYDNEVYYWTDWYDVCEEEIESQGYYYTYDGDEISVNARGGYPTGRAWSKEHYNDNDGEDYEIDPDKRIVKARNRYAKGGWIEQLFGKQVDYPTGGAWTKEHYNDNDGEDYEVDPAKRKVKARNRFKEGGDIERRMRGYESRKKRKFYDLYLSGTFYSLDDAIDYARGLDWSEVESTEQDLPYMDYKDSVNGIDIFYNYGTDDYYFADSEKMAKGGWIERLFGKQVDYPTGGAWSKEHYNDNEAEDYEVDPAKRKVKARNRY